MMRHIPNILSTIRLLLVGVFVWLFVAGMYLPALCVFVAAFFTDILDGYLARRNGWITDVGKLLDPLADKLMTIAALACIYFGRRHVVYLAVFLIMLVKEVMLLIGGLLLVKKDIVVYSDWPGKIAAGLFAAGVTLALLSFVLPGVEPWSIGVLCIATALSCYAFVFYAAGQWKNLFPKSGGSLSG